MAILIKQTENKKITISGTQIQLPEVYGRIRFLGDYNGISIEGEVMTFVNYETYVEGKVIYTDVPIGNYKTDLQIGEVQSLQTAHKYAKIAYEQQGYDVEILEL